MVLSTQTWFQLLKYLRGTDDGGRRYGNMFLNDPFLDRCLELESTCIKLNRLDVL